MRKKGHYRQREHYTGEQLDRFRMADVLNDARCAWRELRELRSGANPEHYGCTPGELEEMGLAGQAEYRQWRNARAAIATTTRGTER